MPKFSLNWKNKVAPSKAPDAANDGSRKSKPVRALMCVDLVEDQMRFRAVGVLVAFAAFLAVGSDILSFGDDGPDEQAARVMFSSLLPAQGYLGPVLTQRAHSVMVVSSLGRAYVRRECPSVNETHCKLNSSYSEPVVVTVGVRSLSYGR